MAEGQTHKVHRKAKDKSKKPKSGTIAFIKFTWSVYLFQLKIGTNPKAFAFAAPGRRQKQAARSHDV